jgi:phosphoserine aminotransferase
MEFPELTWQYILSPAGAVALTIVTVNAVRTSTGYYRAWVPLAAAFAWQALAWAIWSDHTAQSAGLSLATTLFVWLAATGGNEQIAARAERSKRYLYGTLRDGKPRFWERWVD